MKNIIFTWKFKLKILLSYFFSTVPLFLLLIYLVIIMFSMFVGTHYLKGLWTEIFRNPFFHSGKAKKNSNPLSPYRGEKKKAKKVFWFFYKYFINLPYRGLEVCKKSTLMWVFFTPSLTSPMGIFGENVILYPH